MEFIIPRQFSIFGKTIKVIQPWKIDKEDSRGEFNYVKGIIKIKRGLPKEEKEVIFLHEVTHAILEYTEYESLSEDERLVEIFSKALHQVLKTQI